MAGMRIHLSQKLSLAAAAPESNQVFTFFLKRGFVNDVLHVLGSCFDEAAVGKHVIQGFALNTRAPFTSCLERWVIDETSNLDALKYGSPLEIGDAIHRCRVCIGVSLSLGAYDSGAIDIPKRFIKKFWKPANDLSDHYFMNLRARTPEPFSKAVREKFGEVLENAS